MNDLEAEKLQFSWLYQNCSRKMQNQRYYNFLEISTNIPKKNFQPIPSVRPKTTAENRAKKVPLLNEVILSINKYLYVEFITNNNVPTILELKLLIELKKNKNQSHIGIHLL